MNEYVMDFVEKPDRLINITCVLVAVGLLISSLEWLSLGRQFEDRGMFSWRVRERTQTRSHRVLAQVIGFVMSPPVFRCVLISRLFAVCWYLLLPSSLFFPIAILFICQLAIHYRCIYGLEGADQMTLIILVSLLVYSIFPTAEMASVSLGFLAAQAGLAYFISGITKLFGNSWRKGTAVREILRTRGFGSSLLWRWLYCSRVLTLSATYLVLIFECSFPLVFVVPPPYSLVYVFLGCIFHIINALIMGLNQFVWSFAATYPAIMFCSFHISKAIWRPTFV